MILLGFCGCFFRIVIILCVVLTLYYIFLHLHDSLLILFTTVNRQALLLIFTADWGVRFVTNKLLIHLLTYLLTSVLYCIKTAHHCEKGRHWRVTSKAWNIRQRSVWSRVSSARAQRPIVLPLERPPPIPYSHQPSPSCRLRGYRLAIPGWIGYPPWHVGYSHRCYNIDYQKNIKNMF